MKFNHVSKRGPIELPNVSCLTFARPSFSLNVHMLTCCWWLFVNSESLKNTPENNEMALRCVSTMMADMGGTEIRRTLQAVYDLPMFPGYPRTVSLDLWMYRQVSNIRRTSSQNLIVSRPVLQLSLCNVLKPGVKNNWIMQSKSGRKKTWLWWGLVLVSMFAWIIITTLVRFNMFTNVIWENKNTHVNKFDRAD